MAINPVGPVGVSPQSAPPNSGDRRFESWTTRTSGAGTHSVGGVAVDRVDLSETAREIASAVTQEEPKLNLSPAELRAMITPEIEEPQRLKSAQGTDDSSSNIEERHAR
jgi:hypothetical protein